MAAAAVSDVPEGMVQSVFMDSLYAYVIRHPSTISALRAAVHLISKKSFKVVEEGVQRGIRHSRDEWIRLICSNFRIDKASAASAMKKGRLYKTQAAPAERILLVRARLASDLVREEAGDETKAEAADEDVEGDVEARRKKMADSIEWFVGVDCNSAYEDQRQRLMALHRVSLYAREDLTVVDSFGEHTRERIMPKPRSIGEYSFPSNFCFDKEVKSQEAAVAVRARLEALQVIKDQLL